MRKRLTAAKGGEKVAAAVMARAGRGSVAGGRRCARARAGAKRDLSEVSLKKL